MSEQGDGTAAARPAPAPNGLHPFLAASGASDANVESSRQLAAWDGQAAGGATSEEGAGRAVSPSTALVNGDGLATTPASETTTTAAAIDVAVVEGEAVPSSTSDGVDGVNGASTGDENGTDGVHDVQMENGSDAEDDLGPDDPVRGPLPSFSWRQPHPAFAIILTGPEEVPFGIHLDFLISKSAYYHEFFEKRRRRRRRRAKGENGVGGADDEEDGIEVLLRRPDISPHIFSYVQRFLYTGTVASFPLPPDDESEPDDDGQDLRDEDGGELPNYDVLVSVWKAGYDLAIPGLGNAVLAAMRARRALTGHVPAPPLLVRAWKDTPEHSKVRDLLLEWAAEYMRKARGRGDADDAGLEFARALPREVLSELVVTMSRLPPEAPAPAPASAPAPANAATAQRDATDSAASGRAGFASAYGAASASASPLGRAVHYLDEEGESNGMQPARKRPLTEEQQYHRHSLPAPSVQAVMRRKPGPKPGFKAARRLAAERRLSGAVGGLAGVTVAAATTGAGMAAQGDGVTTVARLVPRTPMEYTDEDRLNFCADLLLRMTGGPGFWTRLVRPFKEAVNPVRDGVRDYLEKVPRPMDLGTIKAKMDRREYSTADEFAADVRQIWLNCYLYWKPNDPLWNLAKKLEKTFEEKFAEMDKWLAKLTGTDADVSVMSVGGQASGQVPMQLPSQAPVQALGQVPVQVPVQVPLQASGQTPLST